MTYNIQVVLELCDCLSELSLDTEPGQIGFALVSNSEKRNFCLAAVYHIHLHDIIYLPKLAAYCLHTCYTTIGVLW